MCYQQLGAARQSWPDYRKLQPDFHFFLKAVLKLEETIERRMERTRITSTQKTHYVAKLYEDPK